MKVLERCSIDNHAKWVDEPCPYCVGTSPEKKINPYKKSYKQMYEVPCRICGRVVERENNIRNALCVLCKEERNRKYQKTLTGRCFVCNKEVLPGYKYCNYICKERTKTTHTPKSKGLFSV